MDCNTDLLIVGAGPAGISAAINAASEGLTVRVLDSGEVLGGQAKESNSIENYPGFPESITGVDLMQRLVQQALKFGVKFSCPVVVQSLIKSGNFFSLMSDDYQAYMGRSVLLAMGLQYRRLIADGIGPLMGKGIYYGLPTSRIPSNRNCNVVVVGGANSAGQAVVKLAQNKKIKIRLLIRKTLQVQMSKYLVDHIKDLPNVTICEHCEVTSVHGEKGVLTYASVMYGDGKQMNHEADYMFIFIGASPKTLWLKNTLELDDKNYIVTGTHSFGLEGTGTLSREPYETSMEGVFAAGDIRSDSVKRIAAASGEGSSAVPYIHKFLARMGAVV